MCSTLQFTEPFHAPNLIWSSKYSCLVNWTSVISFHYRCINWNRDTRSLAQDHTDVLRISELQFRMLNTNFCLYSEWPLNLLCSDDWDLFKLSSFTVRTMLSFLMEGAGGTMQEERASAGSTSCPVVTGVGVRASRGALLQPWVQNTQSFDRLVALA